ncbi:MAG: 6,7-dimethyl-8-ribityllumazine synthase [Dehalococcoidia bacterium]|nr:6,7-dimethyl-8-ribityllumazine synthase [Dehalococcoidia bacterium]
MYGEDRFDAAGLRVAIVVAMFNDQITRRLCDGALGLAAEYGVRDADLEVYWVPGAFEIPIVAQRLAEDGEVDAVCAIGAVIRGETPHFELVASETTRALMEIGRETGIPVGNGVIATNDLAQAEARAGGAIGNKGAEAMYAALHTACLLRQIGSETST